MRNFLNLKDIPARDLKKILFDAKRRKRLRKRLNNLEIDKGAPLKGKLLIQMFEKSSLRTRLSFYLAIKQLGGSTLTLRPDELHLSKGAESIEDSARILSNFGNAFMLRTDSDKKLTEFKKHLSIPIINGLSPSSHATQILSDIFTVEEIKKLTNSEIYTLNEYLKPEDGEYYWKDLIQLEVYNENNEFIGIVSEIRNYGANDTLVIKNKTSQLLIPYVKDIFIKKIDLVKGFLIVDWDKDEL